ncbi:MAG: hypothetical protein NZM13_02320 [Cyclobacteriaceae bacterium]|nr:hypothetical protein [Cyclobacteriaceae bacterium]
MNGKFKIRGSREMVQVGGVLFVITALVHLSSCCFPDERETAYRLEPSQKNLLPYNDGQALRFRSTLGFDFDVRVSRELTNLNVRVNDCMECCPMKEKLELEITAFDADTIWFPILVAVPLKSFTAKDLGHHLKVITTAEYQQVQQGMGDYLRVDERLSFDEARNLLCANSWRVTCHETYDIGGNTYSGVTEIELTDYQGADRFSFYSCFFNQSGLISIRRTLYINDNPAGMYEYYQIN